MTKVRGSLRGFILVLAAFALCQPAASGTAAEVDDAAEVRQVVERFLVALGERRLEEVPAMFAPAASIGSSRLRDGKWAGSTAAFEQWFEAIRSGPPFEPFEEPVSEWSVRVEHGRMAHVRADAMIVRNGEVRSRNIDYFTLVKLDGEWKILSASYVATPPGAVAGVDEEAAVLAAEDAWVRAEIDGDEATLRRVLDDDFGLNRSNGTTGGKEDLIRGVLGFDMTDQKVTERSVVVSGDTAVVFGTAELFFATGDGGQKSSLLRYTTTWTKRSGQWRAIALHMSGRAAAE